MKFTKMEGCGNDYVYINGFEEQVDDPAALSVRMSRYHFGCGSDGLILILPSRVADARMQMFNNDGSESEMCGNGIRCVAAYCHDRGLVNKTVITYAMTLVSMGNPHAICFVDNPDTAPVSTHGPLLERHPDFPRKANIEFVQVIDREHIRLRVWERGTGETLACGTGACASTVACILNGLCDRAVQVDVPGGRLTVTWDETDNHVYLTGPATFVYDGVWLQD